MLFLLFADAPSSAKYSVHTQTAVQDQHSHKSFFAISLGNDFLSQQYLQEPPTSDEDSELFSFIKRPSQQQAIRFLHPKQQSDFILVFELLLDTYIKENRLRPDKPKQPWYQCTTRPNNRFIDACKPANFIYKARLTYHA